MEGSRGLPGLRSSWLWMNPPPTLEGGKSGRCGWPGPEGRDVLPRLVLTSRFSRHQNHNHNNGTDSNFNSQRHGLSSYIGLHAGVKINDPPPAYPGASFKTQCSLQTIMCSLAFALDTTVITHQWQMLEQSHEEQREQRKSLKRLSLLSKGFRTCSRGVQWNHKDSWEGRIHQRIHVAPACWSSLPSFPLDLWRQHFISNQEERWTFILPKFAKCIYYVWNFSLLQ